MAKDASRNAPPVFGCQLNGLLRVAAQGGAGIGTGKSGVDTPSNGVAPDLETVQGMSTEDEPCCRFCC